MLDCLASSQSGTGMKKLTMPELFRYRTNPTQSGIFLVWYRTKLMDIGMPMLALVFLMPMPSYADNAQLAGTAEIVLALTQLSTDTAE
jgi:hypothetical protein